MRLLFFFVRYLIFLFRSGNAHGLHSPFVFKLYTEVLNIDKHFYVFENIEQQRKLLLSDTEKIMVEDFGTGKSELRKISSIAKRSLKQAYVARMLFRLAQHLKSDTILELGTSLGITTLYLSNASSTSTIYTIEGCQNLSKKAHTVAQKLSAQNIHFITGNIDIKLPQLLNQISKIDFVFIDANHTYEATVRYFEMILEKIAPSSSCLVFDDIHWSADMEKAWKYVAKHPKVSVSIDTFYVGIVFFHTSQPKQHFVLRC